MHFNPRYLSLEAEVEAGILRHRFARQRAEDLVRDRGWTEKDEDFEFQIEQETKTQWEEAYEQEYRWEIEDMNEVEDGSPL